MKKIIGLDIGEKRIGVAISDELNLIAFPAVSIEINSCMDTELEIEKIVRKYNPAEVIIGLPKKMDGKIGIQAENVIKLADELRKRLNTEIKLWDERLTTVSANKILIESGVKRKKRKTKIDSLAASIILQSYLDTFVLYETFGKKC